MAEVRKRVAVKHEPTATASCSQTGESEATEVVNHQQKSDVQTSHGSQSQRHLIVSWLVITIASAAALGTAAYYVGRSKGLERAGPSPVPRHMSSSQLAKYNGFDDPRMLLSILGQVFDVTSGKSYYEPGTPYYFFIARVRSIFKRFTSNLSLCWCSRDMVRIPSSLNRCSAFFWSLHKVHAFASPLLEPAPFPHVDKIQMHCLHGHTPNAVVLSLHVRCRLCR
eukprot:m.120951 g.120951  ORF g.120951 m.120951 type:complete len:224 (+) comp13696_c0_seq5:58-729(+)